MMKDIKLNQERFFLYCELAAALLIGAYLRTSIVILADFPINDGGLFWSMTQDLIYNHFTFPQFTSYNLDQIPYAYPPGAFYLLGFINQGFQISLVDLFRFLPLFFCILDLFLIYPIARLITSSQQLSILATFIYALIRPSYEWLFMGGGVTRSPAFFFSLLSILFTLKSAKDNENKFWPMISALSISLTAYFHLEIAFITSLLMLFIYLSFKRGRSFFRFLLYQIMIGGLCISPYLFTVINAHGTEPLLSALASGNRDFSTSISLLFVPVFTAEPFFPILAVLGALGGLACVLNRRYFLVFWMLIVLIFDSRSVHRTAALPETLLIAVGIETYILNGVNQLTAGFSRVVEKKESIQSSIKQIKIPGQYLTVSLILVYSLILTHINQTYIFPANVLSKHEREAFTWITENTDSNAAFLTLPVNSSWEQDWVSEWFPALTLRHDVLTVQGYEWVSGTFKRKINTYDELIGCKEKDQNCFNGWKKNNCVAYDYLVWPKRSTEFTRMQISYFGILNGCKLNYSNPDMDIYRCSS